MKSLMLTTAARVLTALVAVFSIYLLLRGHNNPGGGFAGGLVASAAVTLQAIANGPAAARRMLRVNPQVIAVLGVAVATFAGLVGPLTGQPFLAGIWAFPMGLPLGTPLLFDLGVYMVVVGAVSALVLALEEEG